jgi:hypothetical protein
MKLAINIDMDNAAFEDGWQMEAMNILKEIGNDQIHRIPNSPECTITLKLRDTNGNTVGSIAVSP